MYDTLDMRGLDLRDMATAVELVAQQRKLHPQIDKVILSRSQRERLVKSDPTAYSAALVLQQQFEKPISELDFVMVIEKCRVVVE